MKRLLCGITTAAIGMTVLAGWIMNIPILTQIHPQWVTMKTVTAFSFVLSGIIVIGLSLRPRRVAYVAISAGTFGLLFNLLGMASLQLLDISLGIEALFAEEHAQPLWSVSPGEPSLGTTIAFLCVAMTGLWGLFDTVYLHRWTARLVTLIGAVAVAGYALSLPLAYFYIPNHSTAMAFHTAIGFIIAGLGLELSREKA